MKKQKYITPLCEEIAVTVEQMLAVSLDADNNPGDNFGGDVRENNSTGPFEWSW